MDTNITTTTEVDPFDGVGLRIALPTEEGAFLKVKETLTRVGLQSRTSDSDKPTLVQSCHILHKKGQYAIVHFKEMFSLDHRESTFSEEDEIRRDAIALLLSQWGLLSLLDQPQTSVEQRASTHFKVIPFKEKANWNLKAKYTFYRKNNGS